jgi:hypothetical protein
MKLQPTVPMHRYSCVVMLYMMIPIVILGVVFARTSNNLPMIAVFGVLAFLVLVVGIMYVSRLDMQQSVKLGFVCPQCRAGLYCATGNRLWIRGECPHCKQFIIEKLD